MTMMMAFAPMDEKIRVLLSRFVTNVSFNPQNILRSGRWTQAEHECFLDGLRLHDKGWKQIAQMIPSRTVVQIRTHAQKYFQKVGKANHGGAHSNEVRMDTRPFAAEKRRHKVRGLPRILPLLDFGFFFSLFDSPLRDALKNAFSC